MSSRVKKLNPIVIQQQIENMTARTEAGQDQVVDYMLRLKHQHSLANGDLGRNRGNRIVLRSIARDMQSQYI